MGGPDMTGAEDIPRVEKVEKVWAPDSYIYVPHKNKELVFAYPSFGPNTYQKVGAQILSKGLKLPNGEHTASLVYPAYCNPQVGNVPEFNNIKQIMRDGWFWVYTGLLWESNGVYGWDDSRAEGLNFKATISGLEKMLRGGKERDGIRFNKNNKVRFAYRERCKLGEQTSEEFAKNGIIIVAHGVDGAEELGEVSTKFPNKPYVWGIETEGEPVQRVSALYEDYYGDRLCFDGYNIVDDRYGRAFGRRS